MKIKKISLIILLLIIPAIVLKYTTKPPISGLEVYFLDVGQGDAILIRNSQGKNILIDGGPDESVLEKIGRILPYDNRKIDVMILTHPHADHLIGLIAILKRYQVDTVIYTGANYSDSSYRYFQELASQKAKNITIAQSNISLDLKDNCRLNILFPFSNVSGQDFKNINNSSIVSELSCDRNKILLMGDAEKEVEQKLIKNHSDLSAEILKLGHHGSKTASSLEFLKEVNPKLAIILVGKDNKYNLPSPEIIERLQETGPKVIRSDQDGELKIQLKTDVLNYQNP
ncbi:MAG: ComEC/Rec2 family competence protein [Candidatus Falkowbacteria bacterium]